MTKIYALLFAVALLLSGAPGCSWFSKHPVIPAVVTCSGKTIPIQLVEQVYGDVMAENWIDLATNVIPLLSDGWADVTCVLNYLSTSNPETVAHIAKLKAAHVELRGGSACNDSRSPKALQAAVVPRTTVGGKLSLASCDRACGAPRSSLVVEGGAACSCWRASKTNWRDSRWIPLRSAPGLGLVAAR